MSAMLSRAKKIGVDAPAQILTTQLDAIKMSITSYEKRQQALLRGSASRALLAEPDEDEYQIIPSARSRAKHIMYDLDEEEEEEEEQVTRSSDDEEEHIVYDFDEEVEGSVTSCDCLMHDA